MSIFKTAIKHLIILSCFSLTIACHDDNDGPFPPSHTGLDTATILVKDIQGIPDYIQFNKVKAEIQGNDWAIVATVEGNYDGNTVSMNLPKKLGSELLMCCQRNGNDYGSGYWPTTCSDTLAGVAALGDFIAYDGDEAVGRIYLSDWSGEGSTAGKAFVYYHYAERAFDLSGSNKSFTYGASFLPGWNAFAYIRSLDEGSREHCTTNIPEELDLHWRFEAWKQPER